MLFLEILNFPVNSSFIKSPALLNFTVLSVLNFIWVTKKTSCAKFDLYVPQKFLFELHETNKSNRSKKNIFFHLISFAVLPDKFP